MNPSIHLRIDSVIRALQEVVLPAVHADDRAVEQLQMSLAHLGVVRAHIDAAVPFERFELNGYEQLAVTLLEAAGRDRVAPDPQVDDARRELADILRAHHTLDPAGVRERSAELGWAIEKIVAASSDHEDDDFRSAVMAELLRSERLRVDANRAMFLGMGWEPGDDLPDIASIVGTSAEGITVDGLDVVAQPVEAQ